MRNKLLILGFTFSVAINAAVLLTIGFHWRGGCGEEHYRREGHHQQNFLSRELNLSSSQKEQMKNFEKSFQTNMKDVSFKLNEKRGELINLLSEFEPNQEEINIRINEIASLQAELQKYVIDYLLEQKGVLDLKQQDKFFSLIEKRFDQEANHHSDGGFSAVAGRKGMCLKRGGALKTLLGWNR